MTRGSTGVIGLGEQQLEILRGLRRDGPRPIEHYWTVRRKIVKRLAERGLVVLAAGSVRLTPTGRDGIDAIVAQRSGGAR